MNDQTQVEDVEETLDPTPFLGEDGQVKYPKVSISDDITDAVPLLENGNRLPVQLFVEVAKASGQPARLGKAAYAEYMTAWYARDAKRLRSANPTRSLTPDQKVERKLMAGFIEMFTQLGDSKDEAKAKAKTLVSKKMEEYKAKKAANNA